MLLFKKKFLADIRSGAKTQTIRLWPYCRMKAGQRSYIPGAGYIRVLAVDPIDVASLSDADAIPDGFPDAASLQVELLSLYGPQLAAGQRAYRIRFALLPPAEQAEAVAARGARVKEEKIHRGHSEGVARATQEGKTSTDFTARASPGQPIIQ